MIINILEGEHKVTKAGVPFMRFATSQGWVSCFDKPTYEAVDKCKGGSADVEVSKSGNYTNISKFLRAVGADEAVVETKKPSSVNGQKAMYVSYCKDVFCAMMPAAVERDVGAPAVMEQSVELIKLAMNAFD